MFFFGWQPTGNPCSSVPLDDVRAVIIAARGVTIGPIFFPAR
jgi:hypothetical protein